MGCNDDASESHSELTNAIESPQPDKAKIDMTIELSDEIASKSQAKLKTTVETCSSDKGKKKKAKKRKMSEDPGSRRDSLTADLSDGSQGGDDEQDTTASPKKAKKSKKQRLS